MGGCTQGVSQTTFNFPIDGNLPYVSYAIYPNGGDSYSVTFNDPSINNGITAFLVENGMRINSKTTGGANGWYLFLFGTF